MAIKPQRADFIKSLTRGLNDLRLPLLEEGAFEKLRQYFEELNKWGAKINLVAKAGPEQIIENHFLDSLTLLPQIAPYEAKPAPSLLDVGTGAGFPGLVIKIACPWLNVSLVEPRQKRAIFLKHIVRTLKLEQVAVKAERLPEDAENFSRNYGRPDLITCRALADINKFLQMLAHICPAESTVICMKGPKADEEIKEWRLTANSPFELIGTNHFTMPMSGAGRSLVIFKTMEKIR